MNGNNYEKACRCGILSVQPEWRSNFNARICWRVTQFTCLFVKLYLHYGSRKMDLEFIPNSFEHLALMLTNNGRRSIRVTVYRPGSEAASNTFFEEFSKLLEKLVVYSCEVFIFGDINLHLDIKDDQQTTKLETVLDCFGFEQTVSGPTHKAGQTLDIVLTRSEAVPSVANTVYPPTLSDHSFIITSLAMNRPALPSSERITRTWKKLDREAFRIDLQDSLLCRSEGWTDDTPDVMAESYNSILSSLLNRHASKRTVRNHFRPITPWFNSACRDQNRKTRCFERIYRRSKLQEDRVQWIGQMRSAQEFYRQVQDVYWQNLISEGEGNARKLWNNSYSLMGNKKRSPIQGALTADSFKKLFEEKISKVRSSTSNACPPVYREFDGKKLDAFASIAIDDTLRLISGAATKSCSLDPIPTDLVKFCANELAPFITALFNKLLDVVISLRFFVRRKSHQLSRNQIWTLRNRKTTVQFQIFHFYRNCWNG